MRILIISATAGGGHKAAAKAILGSATKFGFQVRIIDGMDGYPSFLKENYAKSYAILTDHFPWLWNLIYCLMEYTWLRYATIPFFYLFSYPAIQANLKTFQPHIIISTYFGWTPVVCGVLKQTQQAIPVYNCVTDKFTPSKLWFLEPNCRHLVFSDQAKKIATSSGIPSQKVQIFEDIIDPKYNQQMSLSEIHQFKLSQGLSTSQQTILVLGGGESMPNGYKIVQQLLEQNLSAQIVVVCGRNRNLQNQLIKLVKAFPRSNIKVYGFVDFVYQLMNVSDLIICKAGPATIMEGILLKKPLIISSYIWGQEKGNVDFVVKHKLGAYQPNPQKLAKLIQQLLDDQSEFNRLAAYNSEQSFKTDPEAVLSYIATLEKNS